MTRTSVFNPVIAFVACAAIFAVQPAFKAIEGTNAAGVADKADVVEMHKAYKTSYTNHMNEIKNALTRELGAAQATSMVNDLKAEFATTGTISAETQAKYQKMLRGSFNYGNVNNAIEQLQVVNFAYNA